MADGAEEMITSLEPLIRSRLAQVRLLAMDVDGVLTDGTFTYDSQKAEHKRFHVGDGLGLVLLRLMGIELAWISGRESALVARRAKELGVGQIVQGIRNKRVALEHVCRTLDMVPQDVAYIGDDWNDLPAFAIAGIRIAVANAAREVRNAADVVTRKTGGQGAVREVCETILDVRGQRQVCLDRYLNSLQEDEERGKSGQ